MMIVQCTWTLYVWNLMMHGGVGGGCRMWRLFNRPVQTMVQSDLVKGWRWVDSCQIYEDCHAVQESRAWKKVLGGPGIQ